MTTVPQPYDYLIADIPGGVFGGTQSDRLMHLIQTQIPSGQNPVIGSDELNVTVSFDEDLEEAAKAVLDNCVEHCADFFIITSDGGTTDLGDPATVSKAAGLLSSTTLTLRLKLGDGTNTPGFNETVELIAPIMTIDKLSGNFSEGLFAFTIGALLDRGQATIEVTADSMPVKTLIARWT